MQNFYICLLLLSGRLLSFKDEFSIKEKQQPCVAEKNPLTVVTVSKVSAGLTVKSADDESGTPGSHWEGQ